MEILFLTCIVKMASSCKSLIISFVIFSSRSHAINDQFYGADDFEKYERVCKKLAIEQDFNIDIITDEPWRIYYAWNIDLADECIDFNFKPAIPRVVQRFYRSMSPYLSQQPVWSNAALLWSIGAQNNEILLIPQENQNARFEGIPYMHQKYVFHKELPQNLGLMRYQMATIADGEFLVVADCNLGLVVLASRFSRIPFRSTILKQAADLQIGDGFHACLKDRANNDKEYKKNGGPLYYLSSGQVTGDM